MNQNEKKQIRELLSQGIKPIEVCRRVYNVSDPKQFATYYKRVLRCSYKDEPEVKVKERKIKDIKERDYKLTLELKTQIHNLIDQKKEVMDVIKTLGLSMDYYNYIWMYKKRISDFTPEQDKIIMSEVLKGKSLFSIAVKFKKNSKQVAARLAELEGRGKVKAVPEHVVKVREDVPGTVTNSNPKKDGAPEAVTKNTKGVRVTPTKISPRTIVNTPKEARKKLNKITKLIVFIRLFWRRFFN